MRARACDIHRIYIKRRALATPQMDLSCRKASRLLTRAGGHLRSFTSHLTSLYLLGGGGRSIGSSRGGQTTASASGRDEAAPVTCVAVPVQMP